MTARELGNERAVRNLIKTSGDVSVEYPFGLLADTSMDLFNRILG